MKKRLIVAIDGPAGSGKSTTAKLLAQKLGYTYIDTGAMYRAITFLALERGVINQTERIVEVAKTTNIELDFSHGYTRVFANGKEISEQIRTMIVNENVSPVSIIEEVRNELVQKQRHMGEKGGVVMEGRDIGTVVFPNAELKVFLTASIEARAFRRKKELEEKGILVEVNEVKNNLLNRDQIDSTRKASPLTKADGSFEVDTSNITIDEQVEIIFNKVKEIENFLNNTNEIHYSKEI
jgi:cytidylate kinase